MHLGKVAAIREARSGAVGPLSQGGQLFPCYTCGFLQASCLVFWWFFAKHREVEEGRTCHVSLLLPSHCSTCLYVFLAHREIPQNLTEINGLCQHHHVCHGSQHPPSRRLCKPSPDFQWLPAPSVCKRESHHQEPEARDTGKEAAFYIST